MSETAVVTTVALVLGAIAELLTLDASRCVAVGASWAAGAAAFSSGFGGTLAVVHDAIAAATQIRLRKAALLE
jgi:hypothetical protein